MNTNLSHLAAGASPFSGTWSVMRSLLNVYSTMTDERRLLSGEIWLHLFMYFDRMSLFTFNLKLSYIVYIMS